jgi:hypothetical protein
MPTRACGGRTHDHPSGQVSAVCHCNEPGELKTGRFGSYYMCPDLKAEDHLGKRPENLFPQASPR